MAGPWLGEVGFELLYWVPFLAWFAHRYYVPAERLIVLSRGGTRAWYEPFASLYADVFEWVDPGEFRHQHGERIRLLGEQKQRQATPFDERLVGLVEQAVGRSVVVLHPQVMYDLMSPYWWGHTSMEWVFRFTRYRRLCAAPLDGAVALPSGYAAVKFYFSECFPDTPANHAFVQAVLHDLAGAGPLVSLATGLQLDDHPGIDVAGGAITTLPEVRACENLRLQDAVVARACRFVGTYGGFSYLAPFHGVPATAYYSRAGAYAVCHLELARAALASVGAGHLLDVRGVG